MIEFKNNGGTTLGDLATPASGAGTGVTVLQEYCGLMLQISRTADHFAHGLGNIVGRLEVLTTS